jgi:transcriptional regulator with XRE-family HTH domain
MPIAEIIKRLREEKHYSQRKLASLSGVSNTEISRIENGQRPKPSPDVLKKLSPHLGIDYNNLMNIAGYIEFVENKNPKNQNKVVSLFPSTVEPMDDLPPEAIKELETFREFIRHKYKK